jgi:DNA-binding NtrC family response regulator
MRERPRGLILVVDDDADMREALELGLSTRGFTVMSAGSGADAVSLIEKNDVDVVLTDLAMRGMTGLELCRKVREMAPDLPVIVLTAFGNLESAIQAIRAGAYDFLAKPIQLDAVGVALTRAIEHRALQREVRTLRRSLEKAQGFGELIGDSPAMRRVYDLLDRISESSASVLITGESGTGKELVARAIHRSGPRASGPFVVVNCAAMPETLLESELFGHEKGAFTDARAARTGLFVQADGGTLFLDEIGEMPLPLQPKLLRALQEKKIRPLGSTTEVPFDARLVCATNRDLETAVEQKTFREDLYFRVNVVQIHLPPLRARGTDVLLLAQSFVDRLSARARRTPPQLSPEVAEKLLNYPWPGNVRELQNCVERALALSQGDRLTTRDLPPRIADYQVPKGAAADEPTEMVTLEEMENRYILKVLAAVDGSRTAAARILGIDRVTLYRKLERLKKRAPAATD